MPPNATSDIVAAVRRACDSDDAAAMAFSLVYTARTIIDEGNDPAARTFFARLLVKIAGEVDGDALRSATLQ